MPRERKLKLTGELYLNNGKTEVRATTVRHQELTLRETEIFCEYLQKQLEDLKNEMKEND